MSTLHIEEYQTILRDNNGDIADVPHILVGRTQLTYTSTSVRTSFDFDPTTTFVILYADADSYILFGDSTVEADQNSVILPNGIFRSFGIQEGATRIAVIEKT